MKTIKKYPKAELIGCKEHKNGCYLKLTERRVIHSIEYDGMIVLDFNDKDELIGMDFIDGLPYKIKKRKKKG